MNNYITFHLMNRNRVGEGIGYTQQKSAIQRIMESNNKMAELKDFVRNFVSKYDTHNAIFGLNEHMIPEELTTGFFEVAFETTSLNEALNNMMVGESIWVHGLEQDNNRTYLVGHVTPTINMNITEGRVININTCCEVTNLNEGGHVFGEGSDPIAKEDIKPTLDAWLAEIKRLFPKVAKWWDNPVTLGSVGKKDFSGDIDIAIDEAGLKNPDDWNLDPQKISADYAIMLKRARSATPQDVMRRAVIKAIGDYINDNSKLITTDSKSSGNGVLFSLFDQIGADGKPNGKTVQIDTNFGNIDWLKFAYYSDSYAGNVKGLHRTQLMLHMFAAKGFMFKHNKGVQNKETLEWVATNPKEAIAKLNELYHFNIDEKTLQNYHKLQEYLRDHVDKTTLNHIYDIYLKTLDSTRCDIPEDLQPYWVENKDRLGLTGKFLPNDSQLAPMCK
jgi:hypothetical protein